MVPVRLFTAGPVFGAIPKPPMLREAHRHYLLVANSPRRGKRNEAMPGPERLRRPCDGAGIAAGARLRRAVAGASVRRRGPRTSRRPRLSECLNGVLLVGAASVFREPGGSDCLWRLRRRG